LKYDGAGDFQADNPGGKNPHFGIREHVMSAIVIGLSLKSLQHSVQPSSSLATMLGPEFGWYGRCEAF
jgi:transketolase